MRADDIQRTMKRAVAFFLVFLFIYTPVSAGPQVREEKSEQSRYREAKRATYRKQWRQAVQLFNGFKKDFPQSRYRVNAVYWIAYNLDKLSGETLSLERQIALKREALVHLNELLDHFPGSEWITEARTLRINISRDLVIRGQSRYLEYIRWEAAPYRDTKDEVKIAALDALLQIDEAEAAGLIEKLYKEGKHPGLLQKVEYWLKRKGKTIEQLLAGSRGRDIVVPVRVFSRGKPVEGLSRKDFRIYEDNRPQVLKDFQIIKRSIAAGTGKLQPRYFVLDIRVTHYHGRVKEGLSLFIKDILREDDQLSVIAGDKRLLYRNLADKERVFSDVDGLLQEQSRISRARLETYIRDMKIRLKPGNFDINWNTSVDILALVRFIKSYRDAWIDYKKKFLLPDLDKYYRVAGNLAKNNGEKWLINIYQLEMFPDPATIGVRKQRIMEITRGLDEDLTAMFHARTVNRTMEEIERSRKVAEDFPVAEISKLFNQVDVTHHTVFLRTSRGALARDFEYARIAGDIEKSLKRISENTGGILVASADVPGALKTISVKENTCYRLTYTPSLEGGEGKIKIESARKDYRCLYDEHTGTGYVEEYLKRRSAPPPTILVKDPVFEKKTLKFKISHFVKNTGVENRAGGGSILVRVKVHDDRDEKIFDQERNLSAGEKSITITLGFDWLKKGKYEIYIEALDLLSGITADQTIQAEIE